MVRTVKAKTVRSLRKGERAVVLPGPTGAEPWEAWVLGAEKAAECVQTGATPRTLRLSRQATLALPIAEVFCLPLWLQETDAKEFAGMIALQVELRGLQPRGNAQAVFDWTVVVQEGSRTLVTVGVLPASLSPDIHADACESFDLSARYLPLPENALTIWAEQDRLVVAVTRGRHLVYFQKLSEGRVTERVAQDLKCLAASLTMQDILVPLQQVALWTEASPAEVTALQTALQLPVRQAECSSPAAPTTAWKLTPTEVTQGKRMREIKRWQRMGFLIVMAVYLMVVAALATRYFMVTRQIKDLQQWQTAHAKDLAMVQDTRAVWKDLDPVVNKSNYPLELLLHTSELIPAEQLHLTLFDFNDGHLVIKGEAKDFSAASKFEESLRRDPHFNGYTWDMGQPHLLPNDLAQLQIGGTRASSE